MKITLLIIIYLIGCWNMYTLNDRFVGRKKVVILVFTFLWPIIIPLMALTIFVIGVKWRLFGRK